MRLLKHLILALSLALLASATWAQTIPNPSFEADHYVSGAGYASQNGGSITGWVISDPSRIGLNLGGTNTPGNFVDNGAIPNGTNVAFIQSNGATNTLSTTMAGLTPGVAYRVSFRANSRSAHPAPNASWSLNGGPFVLFTAAPAVGGSNPYYTNHGAFLATGPTASLVLRNGTNAVTDATVLVDNFSITALPQVISVSNSGAGSLRQIVASAVAGDIILFAPALSGPTITLASEITFTNKVTIDASSLSAGLTISGANATRLFTVNSGQTVSLLGLTFTAGNGSGGNGGAIQNSGTLTLTNCTLAANSGAYGGAIINNPSGTLTLTHCTLAANSANGGGAIVNASGTATLTQCTLAANSSTGTEPIVDGGGAIDNYNGGTLNLTACILAGNSSVTGDGPDLWMENGPLSANHCLIGNGTSSTLVDGVNGNRVGPGFAPINPLLAPLGNYGGAAPTMPPTPGSLAIDAAGVSGFAIDQRGYPRPVGLAADIGAVEGIYNDAGPGSITNITRLPDGSVRLSFTNLTDASFPVVATTNVSQPLSNWTAVGFATETSTSTNLIQFTDPQAASFPARFYRVKSP